MNDERLRGFERAVRKAYRGSAAGDADARERLLERIRGAPRPRRSTGPHRLLNPIEGHPQRVLLVAAGFLVLAGAGWTIRAVGPPIRAGSPVLHDQRAASDDKLIRFELQAPGASRVALVGDFNGWDPAATPMRRDRAPSTWSVMLPLARGRHVYGFVVDERRWMPDPVAPLAPEDGFGSASSVIVVAGVES
jgi:hypothetical protein